MMIIATNITQFHYNNNARGDKYITIIILMMNHHIDYINHEFLIILITIIMRLIIVNFNNTYY